MIEQVGNIAERLNQLLVSEPQIKPTPADAVTAAIGSVDATNLRVSGWLLLRRAAEAVGVCVPRRCCRSNINNNNNNGCLCATTMLQVFGRRNGLAPTMPNKSSPINRHG